MPSSKAVGHYQRACPPIEPFNEPFENYWMNLNHNSMNLLLLSRPIQSNWYWIYLAILGQY